MFSVYWRVRGGSNPVKGRAIAPGKFLPPHRPGLILGPEQGAIECSPLVCGILNLEKDLPTSRANKRYFFLSGGSSACSGSVAAAAQLPPSFRSNRQLGLFILKHGPPLGRDVIPAVIQVASQRLGSLLQSNLPRSMIPYITSLLCYDVY